MLPARAAARVVGAGSLGRGSPAGGRKRDRGRGLGGAARPEAPRCAPGDPDRAGRRSPRGPGPRPAPQPRPRGPLAPEEGAPRCGRQGARLRALAAPRPAAGPGGPSPPSAPRGSPAHTPTPRARGPPRPPGPAAFPASPPAVPGSEGLREGRPPRAGIEGTQVGEVPAARPRPRRPVACAEFIVARAARGHRRASTLAAGFKVVASRCERGEGGGR